MTDNFASNQYIKIYSHYNKSFVEIQVNDYKFLYSGVLTIYQALLQKGWYLPRFCFHLKLFISGNCRMCFVELENISKPIVACSTNISNNLVVFINSLISFKSRENILEFILINHPIDCPVCDQGGECDLQDQYVVMGSSNSRYYENFKKSVKNKNLSFLIKISLNKCINCSRCVRFTQQILGNYVFSLMGRGENSSITNYINKINTLNYSEIDLNLIELCPVGSLTKNSRAKKKNFFGALSSKLSSYDLRIWELIDVKFIDLFDTIQPHIRIDFRGSRIQRVIPIVNSDTEEEWISNGVRYFFKNLFKFRFYLPHLKKKNNFVKFSWHNFFNLLKNSYIKLFFFFSQKKLFFTKNINLSKNNLDIYNYNVYSFFFKKFNFFNFNFIAVNKLSNLKRETYFIKNKDLDFLNVEQIFICFLNFRYNFPLFNYKLREKMIFDYIEIFLLGSFLNLNFYFVCIGNCFNNFINFFKKLKLNKNYLFFFNEKENFLFNILNNKNSFYLYNFLKNNKNLIQKENGYPKFLKTNNFFKFFNINFNNEFFLKTINKSNKLLSIIFSTNLLNLKHFNVFMPKKLNFEQNSIFVNIFGVFNNFTYLIYKASQNSLKTDLNIFSFLFKKFNFNKEIKLSTIKNKFVSDSWSYLYYNFTIHESIFIFLQNSVYKFANLYKNFYLINFLLFKSSNNYVELVNTNAMTWLF